MVQFAYKAFSFVMVPREPLALEREAPRDARVVPKLTSYYSDLRRVYNREVPSLLKPFKAFYGYLFFLTSPLF